MDDAMEGMRKLWREYSFFTREMVKFLKKDDIDMFLTLLDEQEEIANQIRHLDADDFVHTEEGRKMKLEIRHNIQILMADVQFWLNRERVKQRTARSYDSLGEMPLGQSRDWNG